MTGFAVVRTISLAGLLAFAMATTAFAQRDDVVVGVTLEPPHLDPTAGAAAAIDEVVYANLFEGLTRIDQSGVVQPALAESWDISDDGLVYTFHLHDGVTFHDGTTFDADDVVFSLDRARADDSVNAQKGLFEPIESVEALSPLEVQVTLKRPTALFPWNLGWGDAVMVGDTTFDILMARNAGTPSVGVSWGVHPPQELRAAGADHIVEAINELLPVLDRLTAG